MSFCVSYSDSDANPKPYDDWVARCVASKNNTLDAIFQYKAAHCQGCTETKYYLMPGCNFGYIEYYAEFVVAHFKLWVELSFDVQNKKVHVEQLFCERENYWEQNNPKDFIESGSGDIEFYKTNMEALNDGISLDRFVERFFGPEWSMAPLPTTRLPLLDKDKQHALVDQCEAAFGDYKYGPWFKTISLYI